MFAGQMKLRTFLALAGSAGLLVVGGVGLLWSQREPAPPVQVELTREVPVSPSRVEASRVEAEPIAVPTGTGRPVDAEVLAFQGRDIGSDKLKDVTKGRPYKVNVYQDAGESSVNRAKIDLDRDDKWDEKIDFTPEGVKRQLAPNDDEVYSETTWLEGGSWVVR